MISLFSVFPSFFQYYLKLLKNKPIYNEHFNITIECSGQLNFKGESQINSFEVVLIHSGLISFRELIQPFNQIYYFQYLIIFFLIKWKSKDNILPDIFVYYQRLVVNFTVR